VRAQIESTEIFICLQRKDDTPDGRILVGGLERWKSHLEFRQWRPTFFHCEANAESG